MVRKNTKKRSSAFYMFFFVTVFSISIILPNTIEIININGILPTNEFPTLGVNTVNSINFEYFDYYKNITIDHTKVQGTHVNFPLLISLFDSDLHNHTQNSGNDIVFYSNSEWLDHEIEFFDKNYNGTHAKLITWVRLPSISNLENIVITMFFGNSTIGSEQNPEGVWDDNYVMVQHFNGSSYLELDDSTKNNNDVSDRYGTPNYNVEGWIGNAVEFDGDADEDGLTVADSNSLDITICITLSAWVKLDSLSEYDKIMVKNNLQDEPWNSYAMALERNSYYFRMEMSDGPGGSQQVVTRDDTTLTSTWYYVTASYDQTTMRISANGENQYTFDIDSMTIATSNLPLTMGREYHDKEFLDGIIDEVRISNITRSHDWIVTEYNNQFEPESFYSITTLNINNLRGDGGGNDDDGDDELLGNNDSFLIIIVITIIFIGFAMTIGAFSIYKIKNNKKFVPKPDDKILKTPKIPKSDLYSPDQFEMAIKEKTQPPKRKSHETKDDMVFSEKKYNLTPLPKLNEPEKVSKFRIQDEMMKKELTKKSKEEKFKMIKEIGKDKSKLD